MYIKESNMIAKPGEGFKIFLNTLTGGRISIAALAVGTAEGSYEKALKYSSIVYDLDPTPSTAYNLGVSYAELEKFQKVMQQ